ncbi:prepilin-type N-terminal cleavage/methylation domain-containing protein [Patescibacteria group bacterium]|nr:MAG: prepilin-type N-terminal cleavage/methylation domain-containing protein [Patescibacteria group bacterium]
MKIKFIVNFRRHASRFRYSGFTLIELLVVIGIIAVLFAVVLIAINPAKRFAEANNTRRSMDARNILDALTTYTADSKNAPPNLPSALTCIGNGQSAHNNGGRAINPSQGTDGTNLSGLWHLDNTANDSSSSAYNGIVGGGTSWNNAGRFGSSLSLSGTSGSSVSVSEPGPGNSALDAGGNFSVSAWVKPANITNGQTIITKGDGSASNYYLKIAP